MKKGIKILLLLGASLLLAACCSKKEEASACECKCAKKECKEKNEEEKQACAQWADFDNQTEDVQKALIAKKKSCIEAKIAKKKEQATACEAQLAGLDSLSIAEQKALLDNCCIATKKCCKSNKECAEKCSK